MKKNLKRILLYGLAFELFAATLSIVVYFAEKGRHDTQHTYVYYLFLGNVISGAVVIFGGIMAYIISKAEKL